MRHTSIAVFLLLLVTHSVEARELPSLVPKGWVLEFTDADSRTRRFISPDGSSTLTARQSFANATNLRRDIERTAFHEGEQITYLRRASAWVVVSGYRDGKIFYRKSDLACGGTRWNQIELVYPRESKRAMDRSVTRIAHDMTEYGGDCR